MVEQSILINHVFFITLIVQFNKVFVTVILL